MGGLDQSSPPEAVLIMHQSQLRQNRVVISTVVRKHEVEKSRYKRVMKRDFSIPVAGSLQSK